MTTPIAQGPVDVNVRPQACPRCGESEHLRTSKWWDNHPNGEHWNTWCCFCGHEATRADDKRSAVENWNNEVQDAALQQLADEGQQMGLWANVEGEGPGAASCARSLSTDGFAVNAGKLK